MKRKLIALFTALVLVCSLSVGAMAASFTAGSRAELVDAFNYSGEDAEVIITLTGDIDWYDYLAAKESKVYKINGETYILRDVYLGGAGEVIINADIEGIDEGDDYAAVQTVDGVKLTVNGDIASADGNGVDAEDESTVTVNGDIQACYDGVNAKNSASVAVIGNIDSENSDGAEASLGAKISVEGNITAGDDGVATRGTASITVKGNIDAAYNGVLASTDSSVTVIGNINAVEDGICAYGNSNVTVTGNVTSDTNGIDANDNSTVTVNGNITAENDAIELENSFDWDDEIGDYVETLNTATVTVNGNVHGVSNGIDVYGNGTVSVKGDVSSDEDDAIWADSNASVTVEGDVTAKGYADEYGNVYCGSAIDVNDEAKVTVTGNVTAAANDAIVAENGEIWDDDAEAWIDIDNKAAVTVTGDVEGGSGYNAIYAQGQSTVYVDGNVAGGSGIKDDVDFSNPQAYSDGGDGVVAADQATVTVTGNAAGGDAYGTYGYGGNGVEAYDEAKVFVGGDVKGGGVSADPGISATVDGSTYSSRGGHGIEMESTAAVTVGGNVYGGSTNGDQGSGGSGVMMYMVMAPTEEEADEIAGELIVTGDVKEGKGAENAEYPGAGIMFHIYGQEEGDVPVEASISVRSVSSINAYNENTEEYDPEMAEKLAENITYTAKTEADSTPDTGDGSHPVLFGILAAAAVLGMGIVLKGKCRSKA